MNVLLMEDNPGDVRLLMEVLVHEPGASVVIHHVERLSSAVEFLGNHEVDLVLLDLSLPDSRGLETFTRLHEVAHSVAIIILTGLDDEDIAARAMQQGAQDYLLKWGIEREILLRSMRYAVERKRAETALRKARDTLEVRVRERTAELAGINEALRGEIQERQRVERALRTSEERYRGIVEDQTELIFRIDPDLRLTFVNGAFCRFFGQREHALLGKLLVDGLGDQEAAYIQEKILSLSREEPVGKSDQKIRNGQRESRWVQWTIRVIHDSAGNPMEYQWVGRDITEAKNMQEDLEEKAKIIKFFAYSVVHDLKSPSVALYGLVRLLQRNYGHALDERASAYCDQILKASEQIGALVESINLYISTRECRLMVEEINLSHLLEMIRAEFSERFKERGVLWVIPEALPLIRGDRLALVRVFRNLVDNALKYGGDQLKSIKVSYRSEGEHHVLSVTDDGVGVNQEDSGQIFELFRRCRKAGRNNVEGAGLGLNIVREIAERHGGRVWVEISSAGTSFNVSVSKML